jgi:hypothetical protein
MSPEQTLHPAIEDAQFSDLQSFYEHLGNKENIFYMFFTSGLLHWAIRTSRMASRAGNIVLLGAGLSEGEVSWIERHSELPFHHILGPADDKTVWELLFRINRYNFGWIDVDCFLLNPDLLAEMTQIDRDVLANCVWSTPYRDLHLLATFFIFLNAEVIRDVTAQLPVTPCTYSYEVTKNSRTVPGATCRVLTDDLVERLAQVLPDERGGKPRYPFLDNFFDTLHVYQLVAQTMGYRLHRVRPLRLRSTDEIVHIGKVSYYFDRWSGRGQPKNLPYYILILQTEILVLKDLRGSLPDSYELRWKKLTGELQRLGLSSDPGSIEQVLRGMLAQAGLTAETFMPMLAG